MHYRILTALFLCTLCSAQCSLQTVRGTWVSYGQMTAMIDVPGSPQPVPTPMAGSAVGRIDYQGRLSGLGTSVLGGQAYVGELNGSIQVNPDCTGTVAFTTRLVGMPAPIPGQDVSRIIVVDEGNEIQAMVTQGLMGKPTGVLSYRRISWGEPQCTSDMIHGTYAATGVGTLLRTAAGQSQPVPAPVSSIGAVAIDYAGKLTGAATVSVAGNMQDLVFPSGTVTVNADCTGTARWKAAPKGSNQAMPVEEVQKIVVLNNGDEIIGLQTQNPLGVPIAISRFKRISPVPVTPNW